MRSTLASKEGCCDRLDEVSSIPGVRIGLRIWRHASALFPSCKHPQSSPNPAQWTRTTPYTMHSLLRIFGSPRAFSRTLLPLIHLSSRHYSSMVRSVAYLQATRPAVLTPPTVPSITFDHPYAPKVALDRELQLPDLETFEFGPLPELESFDQSSLSIGTPPLPYEEDVWQVALELGPANKHVRFYDWELFENGEDTARKTPYITESGPQALDAAFVKDNEQIAAGRVLTGDVFLTSLWNLGLGRSSILFNWNPNLRTFVPAIADGRTTGLSLASAESLTNRFILIGNTFLYLRSFIERTFCSPCIYPCEGRFGHFNLQHSIYLRRPSRTAFKYCEINLTATTSFSKAWRCLDARCPHCRNS